MKTTKIKETSESVINWVRKVDFLQTNSMKLLILNEFMDLLTA